ncbi:MAG: hypothetical protein LBH04_09905 [Tannerellaceae bacterium]|jgi:hypothetical protein|nr:hypothetical protein [Tannerellaceae bacterium]
MFNNSPSDSSAAIYGIIILAIAIYVIKSLFNRNTVHLALSKLQIMPDGDDRIIIEGRKTGLIQWILAKLKLGNYYRLLVKKDSIYYSANSASGEHLTLTPVQKISSTSCGANNPIGWIFLSILLGFIGIIMLTSNPAQGVFLLLLGTISLALYRFNKSFFITIQTSGGYNFGFSFKRSFIENLPVDSASVREVITRINELVLAAQHPA